MLIDLISGRSMALILLPVIIFTILRFFRVAGPDAPLKGLVGMSVKGAVSSMQLSPREPQAQQDFVGLGIHSVGESKRRK